MIVTTHYQRIKELALSDGRFKIAAMEFVDNKPTYRYEDDEKAPSPFPFLCIYSLLL